MQKVIETMRAARDYHQNTAAISGCMLRDEGGRLQHTEMKDAADTAIDLLTKLHKAWEARENATKDTIYTDSHIIDRADDALWSAVEAVEKGGGDGQEA